MDECQLRRVLLGVLNCSLLAGASGCGNSPAAVTDPGPSSIDRFENADVRTLLDNEGPVDPFWPDLPLNEFVTPPCDGSHWRAASGLQPASNVDYAGLYAAVVTQEAVENEEYDALGTACDTASDQAVCAEAVAAAAAAVDLREECGLDVEPFPCKLFLLTTTGDQVQTWVGSDALLRFVGSVDTPEEALLYLHSYSVEHDDYATPYRGLACDTPDWSSARAVSDGYQVVRMRDDDTTCPVLMIRELWHVGVDGRVSLLRSNLAQITSVCVGRRPEGLASASHGMSSQSVLGEFFADISRLEAASVEAFRRLETELEALGAPAALRVEAERAAADEVRHAAETQRLAERFGARVIPPVLEPWAVRELESVAAENVAEGCVRETFGALIAHHQAQHARDPEIRSAMQVIAEDETRHAALAWRVAAWAESQLPRAARERLQQARRHALDQLRADLETSLPDSARELAGMPTAQAALGFFAALEQALWS